MNEKPEGTPNPLNPNPLDAKPSKPVEEVKVINEVSGPEKLSEELLEESVFVESLDPDGKPMEKAPAQTEAKPKKKKTWLIVTLIVLLFAAVGCGVAAALMLMNGEKDPVAVAMKKVMRGETPTNVVVDGTIDFAIEDNDSLISNIKVDLNSQMRTNSLINATVAEITLSLEDGAKLAFELNEIYAANGDLYIKIDGAADLINELAELGLIDTGVSAEDFLAIAFGVVNLIDGEWLKVSTEQLGMLSEYTTMSGDTTCVMDMINDINTNSNSAAELYNKNPFLSSEPENITIDNKLNQVRKVIVDDEKFANFVNSVQNAEITSELYNCMGWSGNLEVTAEDVAEGMANLPAVYVEVDKDNNFSRLYMSSVSEGDLMTITVDLAFSYPANINVSEPVEYTTFEELIQDFMMTFSESAEAVKSSES